MWMGGSLPFGYDTRDRKLVINETEGLFHRVWQNRPPEVVHF
jgi:hypothetical protein